MSLLVFLAPMYHSINLAIFHHWFLLELPKFQYTLSYDSHSVESINYFVFHDRKVVCLATNVFPEQMGSKVARTES